MPDRHKVGFAILLMVGATLCFAALDATSKYLSRTYPIPMMVWGRYTFHLLDDGDLPCTHRCACS
jgi:drug/metabolite transporter (DMT)-like permease